MAKKDIKELQEFKVLRAINHNGKDYAAGSLVELDAESAAALLPIGAIEGTQQLPVADSQDTADSAKTAAAETTAMAASAEAAPAA